VPNGRPLILMIKKLIKRFWDGSSNEGFITILPHRDSFSTHTIACALWSNLSLITQRSVRSFEHFGTARDRKTDYVSKDQRIFWFAFKIMMEMISEVFGWSKKMNNKTNCKTRPFASNVIHLLRIRKPIQICWRLLHESLICWSLSSANSEEKQHPQTKLANFDSQSLCWAILNPRGSIDFCWISWWLLIPL
jgi:hypothetical protein